MPPYLFHINIARKRNIWVKSSSKQNYTGCVRKSVQCFRSLRSIRYFKGFATKEVNYKYFLNFIHTVQYIFVCCYKMFKKWIGYCLSHIKTLFYVNLKTGCPFEFSKIKNTITNHVYYKTCEKNKVQNFKFVNNS